MIFPFDKVAALPASMAITYTEDAVHEVDFSYSH